MKNTILGKPLEFGNTDQIRFLQRSEEDMQEMLSFGRQIDNDFVRVDICYSIEFDCVQCGATMINHRVDLSQVDVSDSVEALIKDDEIKCRSCKCIYKADNGLITLVKNPRHPERVTEINYEP